MRGTAIRSRVVGAAVAVALLAACGPERSDVAQQAATASAPLTAAEIASWRAVWERSAPEAYRYAITSTCGCDRSGTFTVTVVAGEVTSVEPSEVPSGERYRRWYGQSVDQMFDMFDEAVRVATSEGADSQAAAAFDPELGNPRSFEVRWSRQDEPYVAAVTDFAVIDPSEAQRPPRDTVPISITNQSFDHPDAHIRIAVDGEIVIDAVLSVRGQHHVVTYDVPMQPGPHELVVTSDAGALHSQTLDVPRDAPLFVHLSHWTGEDEAPAHFEVNIDDEPMAIL